MKRKIRKYIKDLFGLDVKIKIVHHFYNRAVAKADRKRNYIFIAQAELKYGMGNIKSYLWHEVGHLKTSIDNIPSVRNEVLAELWTLKELLRRGYKRMYADEILFIKKVWMDVGMTGKKWRRMYRKAAKIILEKNMVNE